MHFIIYSLPLVGPAICPNESPNAVDVVVIEVSPVLGLVRELEEAFAMLLACLEVPIVNGPVGPDFHPQAMLQVLLPKAYELCLVGMRILAKAMSTVCLPIPLKHKVT
mmetsp:Transcript_25961/g.12277  ORF Transcript_25961/g.12277 Transcript_25961/m.12277 type:complete len:108 (+) Transcript_25961:276-599(+)